MTLADDGGVVVLGNTRNEGPGSWSVLLWKVSSQGAEEWSSIFGGIKRDRGRRVIRVKPEGYLVCGNTKSFNSNKTSSSPKSVQLEPLNGRSQWAMEAQMITVRE